jgi:hypothetical protein
MPGGNFFLVTNRLPDPSIDYAQSDRAEAGIALRFIAAERDFIADFRAVGALVRGIVVALERMILHELLKV